MFVPNQTGEILIGNAVATETTVPTFIASASDKELKVLSKDGTNVAAKKPFYVLQKADGIPGGFEFSDKVDWINISYRQKLSKDFIREFSDKVSWDYFSSSQKLSEKFIRKFSDKLNFYYIPLCYFRINHERNWATFL